MTVDTFPIVDAKWTYASRFGQQHRGVDIFAPRGSTVVAVANGNVRSQEEPKGGRVVYLTADDGARYYYAHLDDWVGDFPRRVAAGDVIGRVGSTGNAQGKEPHIHFEYRSQFRETLDPVPYLRKVDPHQPTAPAPLVRVPSRTRQAKAQKGGAGGVMLLGLMYLLSRGSRG